MTPSPFELHRLPLAIAASVFLSLATPASAGDSIAATYQAERAACLHGGSGQRQTTCLKEAAAAASEARRGRLDDHQSDRYADNALARCERLPVGDREDCRGRIEHPTRVEGSARDGGVLREYDRAIPAEPSGNRD